MLCVGIAIVAFWALLFHWDDHGGSFASDVNEAKKSREGRESRENPERKPFGALSG